MHVTPALNRQKIRRTVKSQSASGRIDEVCTNSSVAGHADRPRKSRPRAKNLNIVNGFRRATGKEHSKHSKSNLTIVTTLRVVGSCHAHVAARGGPLLRARAERTRKGRQKERESACAESRAPKGPRPWSRPLRRIRGPNVAHYFKGTHLTISFFFGSGVGPRAVGLLGRETLRFQLRQSFLKTFCDGKCSDHEREHLRKLAEHDEFHFRNIRELPKTPTFSVGFHGPMTRTVPDSM